MSRTATRPHDISDLSASFASLTPDEAAELHLSVSALLDSGDWRERLIAAKAAAKLKAPDLRDKLIALLGDSRGSVREAAAAALKATDPSLNLKGVHGTKRDVEAIANALGAESREPLERLLREADPRMRLAVLHKFESLGLFEQALGGLDDHNWKTRHETIEIIRRNGRRELANFVLMSMEDEDARVRRAAAEAFGEIADQSLAPALEHYAADPDPRVRIAVVRSLEELGDTAWSHVIHGELADAERIVEHGGPSAAKAIEYALKGTPSHWTKALAEASGHAEVKQVEPERKATVKKDKPARPAPKAQPKPRPEPVIEQKQPEPQPVVQPAEEPKRVERKAEPVQKDTPSDLLRALGSGDAAVRAAAAAKLGDLKYAPAVDALISLLSDREGNVRRTACGSLSIIGDKRAIMPMLSLMTDVDKVVRSAAQAALENLGAYRMFFSALSDKKLDIRRAAVENLGKLRDPRSLPVFMDLLTDEPPMRNAAATALATLGHGKWDVWVNGDKDDFFRMAKSGDSDAIGVLLKGLDSPVSEIRKQTAEAIGLTNSPAAVERLIAMLRDKYEFAAVAAANALGQMRDQRAVGGLLEMTKDLNWVKRAAAVMALGNIGAHLTIPSVIPLLKDNHFAVRREACTALGKMPDPRAINSLIPMLYDREAEVCGAAQKALKHLADTMDDRFKAEKNTAFVALMEASNFHRDKKGKHPSHRGHTPGPGQQPPRGPQTPPPNPFDFWGKKG